MFHFFLVCLIPRLRLSGQTTYRSDVKRTRLEAASSNVQRQISASADKHALQIQVLQLLNEYTGSTFSGINLNDPVGRFLGFVVWPSSPERMQRLQELSPTLIALLIAAPLHQLFWDERPSKAFAVPDSLFQSTQAYKHVYSKVDMHYVGFYIYPVDRAGNHVIACISRPDRAFAPREIAAFQRVCDRFEPILNNVDAGVPFLPSETQAADHVLIVDRDFRSKEVSAYAHALLAFFYGPLGSNGRALPSELIDQLRRCHAEYRGSVLPTRQGTYFALTKRSRGRLLCLTFQSDGGALGRLTCYEDLSQFERIRRLRQICAILPRDKYSVFSCCLSCLDGIQTDAQVKRAAGIEALRTSSSRRIISKARSIVAEL